MNFLSAKLDKMQEKLNLGRNCKNANRVTAPLIPIFWTTHLRGVWRADASEDWVKQVAEYSSLLLDHCYQAACVAHKWRYALLDFSFSVSAPIEALLTLHCIPCQVQFQVGLSLPDSISRLLSSTSVHPPWYLSLLPLTVHFLLALQFYQQIPVLPYWSPAFLYWLPTTREGDLLYTKERFLKDLPTSW